MITTLCFVYHTGQAVYRVAHRLPGHGQALAALRSMAQAVIREHQQLAALGAVDAAYPTDKVLVFGNEMRLDDFLEQLADRTQHPPFLQALLATHGILAIHRSRMADLYLRDAEMVVVTDKDAP